MGRPPDCYALLVTTTVKERGSKRTTVSSKNQITLPVAALAAAGVRSGDVLRVEVVGEGVFRLVRERSRVDALVGRVPGISAETGLEDLRRTWDR